VAPKTTVAAAGNWSAFAKDSWQGLRPPTRHAWTRREDTAVVRATGRSSARVNLARLICSRSEDKPRLISRARLHRGRREESKSLTWTDYRDLLTVIHLPTNTPDLNPTQGIWSMLRARLVNVTAYNLDRLAQTAEQHLKTILIRCSYVKGRTWHAPSNSRYRHSRTRCLSTVTSASVFRPSSTVPAIKATRCP
jgi:hypothetical protein